MDPSTKASLRTFILTEALRRADDESPLVRTQCSAIFAIFVKRDWLQLNREERMGLLRQVNVQADQLGPHRARCTSLEILKAVVIEFSPGTATPMGQSWAYHQECKLSLQEDYLYDFAQLSLKFSKETVVPAVAADGSDGGICTASLSLLASILNWDFSKRTVNVWSDSYRPSNDVLSIRPPSSWADLILGENLHRTLTDVLSAVRVSFRSDHPLSRVVREVSVSYSALDGDIFPREDKASRQELGLQPSIKELHLHRVLCLWLPVITHFASEEVPESAEEEVLDCCRGLMLAAKVHGGLAFERASSSSVLPGLLGRHLLDVMAGFTKNIVKASGLQEIDAGSWALQALSSVVDCWVELLVDKCRGMVAATPTLSSAAAIVFSDLVERELAGVAFRAFEDEEEVEVDETIAADWLCTISNIGRATGSHALLSLSVYIKHAIDTVKTHIRDGQDPSIPLEHLCLLIEVSSCVLADAGEGELPLVPVAIIEACASGGTNHIIELAHQLVALAAECTQQTTSPRLMEVVVNAVARWADTYLMLDDGPGALVASFGSAANGPQIANTLIYLCTAGFASYPGESHLHVCCCRLLFVLVRNAVRCQIVISTRPWKELMSLVTTNHRLFAIAARPTRLLSKALCLGSVGSHNVSAYVEELIQPAILELVALSDKTPNDLQRGDNVQECTLQLDRLRGFVKGLQSNSQQQVLAQLEIIRPSILSLLRAYHGQPLVVTSIIKLSAGIVQLRGYESRQDSCRSLLDWAINIISIYSAHNKGTISAQAAERREEQYDDLRALLKLLTNITSIETFESFTQTLVSDAVFHGLDVVIPLIDIDLLKFPKLRRSYYALLAHMVEVYPERMCALPFHAFHQVIATIEFGISLSGDPEISEAVYAAIAAIGKFHVDSVSKGGTGIGRNNPRHDGATCTSQILTAIMRQVLFEDGGLETVDFAAEAVLPLIMIEDEAFLQFAHKGGTGMAHAFAQFIQGGPFNLERSTRQGFNKRFRDFAAIMRSHVHSR